MISRIFCRRWLSSKSHILALCGQSAFHSRSTIYFPTPRRRPRHVKNVTCSWRWFRSRPAKIATRILGHTTQQSQCFSTTSSSKQPLISTIPNTVKDQHPNVGSVAPAGPPIQMEEIETLAKWLSERQSVMCVTGAGISTDSSIYAYRGYTDRPPATPMTFSRFIGAENERQRYWARSYFGYPRTAAALPNRTHFGVQVLSEHGIISRIITQNVDSLHSKAGSTDVIELHGRLRQVICLSCGTTSDRDEFQREIEYLNPHWIAHMRSIQTDAEGNYRPDGDLHIDDSLCQDLAIPACKQCSGILKPHVVFFGENVPKHRVELAKSTLQHSDGLLILGSSMTVWSGFRFARYAAEWDIPVCIVNIGPTRADDLAQIKVSASTSEVFHHLNMFH
jgi:NAD-dependent protein deacetylase/lipoamidase sirtuin 4